MLALLIKKQLSEVFKSYFYDAKKNRMRPKWAIAAWFIFFAVIMVGMLGGMFAALSFTLCGPLAEAGLGWMYFLMMGGVAILLGAFGSVFNSYSALYLSKDNDQLLSLPIPVKTIVASRLINVYLLGAMYSVTVAIPMLIVYWIVAGLSAAKLICGLLLLVILTLIVLILSVLLGWVVAKISLRLKNKSFVTVAVSLLFIGLYYFFYFRANDLLRDILANAGSYAEKIRGAAYGLYLFGRIGEGDLLSCAVCTALTALCSWLVWLVLKRSFLGIATASAKTAKQRYTEKAVRQKSAFGALLAKEFGRLASSPNYMLNCCLGVLLIPAGGVLLLIKGRGLAQALSEVFAFGPDAIAVLLCSALCMLTAMNDSATPAVSLEGKSLWLPQSLPVESKSVLRAKAAVELILTAVPMLFASLCVQFVVDVSLPVRILLFAMPLAFSLFSSLSSACIGIRMPLLSWTNEIAPIKQSGGVLISIFQGWLLSVAVAGLYLLAGSRLGAAVYLLIWTVLLFGVSLLLLRWLDTEGSARFDAL